jgi:ribonuclease-3
MPESKEPPAERLPQHESGGGGPVPDTLAPERLAEEILGYRFRDRSLLSTALVHASIANARVESNERLEFLGDAILGMVVCDRLYRTYPAALEGELTKVKSNVVSRKTCAEIAREIGLERALVLGKGVGNRENLPASLAAASFEAVVGALYLDGGLEVAREFILKHLDPRIARAATLGHQHNFKSVLQQAGQRVSLPNPQYVVVEESGPDHAKTFLIRVDLNGRQFPVRSGSSKKQAEQEAALAALLELGFASRDAEGEIRIRHVPEGEAFSMPPKSNDGTAAAG